MTQETTRIIKRNSGHTNDYNIVFSYKAFRQKYPEVKMNRDLHRKIIYEANKLIADVMINDPLGFKMPKSFGTMIGIKKHIPVRHTNYGLSAELDKKIYYINPHTQGFGYALRWVKDKRRFDNCTAYMYDACRKLKLRYRDSIRNKEVDYQDTP